MEVLDVETEESAPGREAEAAGHALIVDWLDPSVNSECHTEPVLEHCDLKIGNLGSVITSRWLLDRRDCGGAYRPGTTVDRWDYVYTVVPRERERERKGSPRA